MKAPRAGRVYERHLAQPEVYPNEGYAGNLLNGKVIFAGCHTQLPSPVTCHTCTPSPERRPAPSRSASPVDRGSPSRGHIGHNSDLLVPRLGGEQVQPQATKAQVTCRSSNALSQSPRSSRSRAVSTLTPSAAWPEQPAAPCWIGRLAATVCAARSSAARPASSATTPASASSHTQRPLTAHRTFSAPPLGSRREGFFVRQRH